jgi:hypothetical protein
MKLMMQDNVAPDYFRALGLVLGDEALKGYNSDALARLEPAAVRKLLDDNGYPEAIEAMAEHVRTFTMVMPQYEPLAAWLASYAWGYGHHVCIALWGDDAAHVLRMMGRYAGTLTGALRPVEVPHKVTLHRGQLLGAPLGWSWTLDRDWAATFLKEWSRPGELLTLEVAPDNILAVIYDHADTEKHDEYVVDPTLACQHFPNYAPMDANAARAMIDEDFPALASALL